MLYIERKELAIIQPKDGEESVSLEELRKVLLVYPSNMIYCELHGKLLGVISTGDICRAHKIGLKKCDINKEFIYVYEGESVKRGFSSLPVVTKDNVLIGEYTKWEYPGLQEYETDIGYSVADQIAGQNIALVEPCSIFEERKEVFKKFSDYLRSQDIEFDCIEHHEVAEFSKTADLVLFVEGNELRAAVAILTIMFGEDHKRIDKFKTYKDIEDGVLVLEQMLLKPHADLGNVQDSNEVLFWMPPLAYFVDSVFPMISRYLRAGRRCTVAIPIVRTVIQGAKNIKGMITIIKRIESMGGNCYDIQQESIYSSKYRLCYLCSEYSESVPSEIQRNTECVVALQTTAIYTHMYRMEGRFYEIFSKEQREKIDFLIASDYMADWICKYDKQWDQKIIRFGYPKLDTLYESFLGEPDIPEEWKRKIKGKKVVLFTGLNESLVDVIEKEGGIAIILRPHPQTLERRKDYITQTSHLISAYAP